MWEYIFIGAVAGLVLGINLGVILMGILVAARDVEADGE